MKPLLRLSILTLAALALGETHASADQLAPRVLVIPLAGKAAASPTRLTAVLVRLATERGARVAQADTGLAETALLVGCDPAEAACLDAMATALNVDHLVFGAVTRRGKNTSVELTVTARGRPPARATIELAGADDIDRVFVPEATRLLALIEPEDRDSAEPDPTTSPPPPRPRAAPARSPPAAPRVGSRSRGWLWLVTGGGATVAVAGGAIWLSGRSLGSDIDPAPTSNARELDELRDLEDRAELRLRVGGAMAVAGVAVAVTGAVLAVRWRSDVTVAAAPTSGGAAVTLGTRF